MTPQRIDLDMPLFANVDEHGNVKSVCIEINGTEVEINLNQRQMWSVEQQVEMELEVLDLLDTTDFDCKDTRGCDAYHSWRDDQL